MTDNLIIFVINSVLLGFGLAMDAFSVCVANGLNERGMTRARKYKIACVFAVFQGIMPMAGWICIHTIVEYFKKFQAFVPWIALILLAFIGIRMIAEALRGREDADKTGITSGRLLFVQGIATSIDALSVGFAIAEYPAVRAVLTALIIAFVTYLICLIGLCIGEKAGTRLSARAPIAGGIVLIIIGIEIFVSNFFG